MEDFRRRVPIAEFHGASNPTQWSGSFRGPDSSLKREFIFVWNRPQRRLLLGTVSVLSEAVPAFVGAVHHLRAANFNS